MRAAVAEASAMFSSAAAIELEIAKLVEWRSPNDAWFMRSLLGQLRGEPRQGADLVVGFTGQTAASGFPSGRYSDSGRSVMFTGPSLIRLERPDAPELSDASVVAHEVGHCFGLWHLRSKDLVMAAGGGENATAFGPTSRAALRISRDIDFERGYRSVSDDAWAKLLDLFRGAHARGTSCPQLGAFVTRLRVRVMMQTASEDDANAVLSIARAAHPDEPEARVPALAVVAAAPGDPEARRDAFERVERIHEEGVRAARPGWEAQVIRNTWTLAELRPAFPDSSETHRIGRLAHAAHRALARGSQINWALADLRLARLLGLRGMRGPPGRERSEEVAHLQRQAGRVLARHLSGVEHESAEVRYSVEEAVAAWHAFTREARERRLPAPTMLVSERSIAESADEPFDRPPADSVHLRHAIAEDFRDSFPADGSWELFAVEARSAEPVMLSLSIRVGDAASPQADPIGREIGVVPGQSSTIAAGFRAWSIPLDDEATTCDTDAVVTFPIGGGDHRADGNHRSRPAADALHGARRGAGRPSPLSPRADRRDDPVANVDVGRCRWLDDDVDRRGPRHAHALSARHPGSHARRGRGHLPSRVLVRRDRRAAREVIRGLPDGSHGTPEGRGDLDRLHDALPRGRPTLGAGSTHARVRTVRRRLPCAV